jgi:uncharacterized protein YfdQ (DUF2303 family)
MPLNKEAIVHLEQNQAAIAVSGKLSDFHDSAVLITKLVALPSSNGVKLESLEQYQESRDRFRGTMTTESFEDFTTYANSKSENTTYINAQDMNAKAFFNLGNHDSAGHGDDVASIRLKPTAAFRALTRISDSKLGQKEAAEFLEDWQANVMDITGDVGENITVKVAANALRNITVSATQTQEHGEHNFGRERSARESIQAQAKDARPNFVYFRCVPYAGLPERTFIFRVGILTGSEPKVVLRVINLETHEEEMAQEFKDILTEKLDESANVYVGSFSLGN